MVAPDGAAAVFLVMCTSPVSIGLCASEQLICGESLAHHGGDQEGRRGGRGRGRKGEARKGDVCVRERET